MRPVDEALKLREGSAQARQVLAYLATFADNDTGVCWPSMATLADVSGLAERTVRRAVAELEESGVMKVDRGKGRAGNRYTLLYVKNAVPLTVFMERYAVRQSALANVDNPVDSPDNAATQAGIESGNAANGERNAATQAEECGHTGRRTYSGTDLELSAVPLGDFAALREHVGLSPKHRAKGAA